MNIILYIYSIYTGVNGRGVAVPTSTMFIIGVSFISAAEKHEPAEICQ